MTIENVQRVPPHVAIRQEIEKRRRSPLVAASGFAGTLGMLDAYIVTTESRLADLARRVDEIEKAATAARGK